MEIDQSILEQALALTGEILAREHSHFHLVVCGGAALVASGTVKRTTHDMDVLATRNYDQEVNLAYPFPPSLARAARDVAAELDLKPNWLNGNASLFFPDLQHLPPDFWADVESRDFGNYLRVDFVSRRGLILLKTYAAMNREEIRDVADLQALAPTAAEMISALKWMRDRLGVQGNRSRLHELLRSLGHDRLVPDFTE